MFFEDLAQIPELAKRTGCTVFVVPPNTPTGIKQALILTPTDAKKTNIISVEQIREFMALASNREVADRFFVITPADAMNEVAQNAFLKTLEEPRPYCHFVLLTEQPNLLLPTILSRAQIFVLRPTSNVLDQAPTSDPSVIATAKQLISTAPAGLPALANDIAKQKTKAREYALDVVATAIELLYKTYFKTQNTKFLAKLPQFLALHEHLSQNGHIKLHLMADLC